MLLSVKKLAKILDVNETYIETQIEMGNLKRVPDSCAIVKYNQLQCLDVLDIVDFISKSDELKFLEAFHRWMKEEQKDTLKEEYQDSYSKSLRKIKKQIDKIEKVLRKIKEREDNEKEQRRQREIMLIADDILIALSEEKTVVEIGINYKRCYKSIIKNIGNDMFSLKIPFQTGPHYRIYKKELEDFLPKLLYHCYYSKQEIKVYTDENINMKNLIRSRYIYLPILH